MLALSSAACGAGKLKPRSRTRLSGCLPQPEISAKNSSIPGEPLPISMQQGVENVAAGGFDGARREVGIPGATNMLR
jgi:hypothetical protein